MFNWVPSREDINQWLQLPLRLCDGSGSTLTLPSTGPFSQICDSADSLAAKDSKTTTTVADSTKDSLTFRDFSKTGYNNQQETLILRQLRSNPSLVKGGSFTSFSVIADKKPDEQSIGSLTVPDSEDLSGLTPRKNAHRKRFILSVVFALLLAMVFIGLVVAIVLRKGNTNNMNNIASNAANAGNTVNSQNANQDTQFNFDTNADTTKVNDSASEAGNVGNKDEKHHDNQDKWNDSVSSAGNNGNSIWNDSASNAGNGGITVDIQPVNQDVKFDYNANTNYLVGTYYYPWHGDNFHNGDGYLRQDLIPGQQPALGEYNDSDPDVIAQHMKWFRQANIGLLVTSWWGPRRTEDTNTKDVIMEHEDIGNLKIALHYETTGRIKDDDIDMSVPLSDIQYMCENYFDHPNYYKINGRPVLFVYVTRVLHREGKLEEVLLRMRSEASKCNHNLFLIGDQAFDSAPDPDEQFVPFWYFDAVTTYDVYGGSGRPEGYAGKELVDKYYSNQEKWRDRALTENCLYIPPVSPGYNDRSVRFEKDHPPLSRKLTSSAEEGSLFWYQLKRALPLVSPSVDNMILVNSFNEWHEDTQIEPAVSIGYRDIPTNQPPILTGGLEYVPYGDLYLDLLAAATSKNVQDTELFDHLLEV